MTDSASVSLVLERLPVPRPDVTGLGFLSNPTAEQIVAIRRFVEGRGWQFSRQNPEFIGRRIDWVYLGQIQPVKVDVAYHATRRASVESIFKLGLLQSVPKRQTTDNRHDCEGNIYLCEQLGTPEDAGKQNARTAHWWRYHLSQHNRFKDSDWVILRVEIGRLSGARLYRDMWSESGIVVDKVLFIPPSLISLCDSI